ncbi:MAG: MotA/TolQ/ExbB proton channel family protein [Phycisphaerae bacterium]
MQERRWPLRTVLIASLVLLVAAVPLTVAQEADPPVTPAKRPAEGGAAEEVGDLATDAPQTFWESLEAQWNTLYKLGGRTMIALAAASIIGFASLLERAISLLLASFSIRGPVRTAGAMWKQGRFGEIERLVGGRSGITARLIDFIVRHREHHIADVSAAVGDLASRYIKRHIRRNYWLLVVAGISPMLGLLGTVLGMIEAFEKVNIAGSMGSAEYLSGAISKALITTAAGLVIGIPALFFYHVYKFLTGVLADTLEGRTNEMVTGWLMRKEAA